MAVTSNCVNETKIFQLELGEKTRTYPILIDLYPAALALLHSHNLEIYTAKTQP